MSLESIVTIIVGIILTVTGIVFGVLGWSLNKNYINLLERVKRMEKCYETERETINNMKYNYLERFNLLNKQLENNRIELIKEIADIKSDTKIIANKLMNIKCLIP